MNSLQKTRSSIAVVILTCLLAGVFGGSVSRAGLRPSAPAAARIVSSFDTGWLFLKGDTTGAEQPALADQAWRKLDVPHDWSIEGPFDKNNPTGGAGGFLPAGAGWYRKHFTLPADDNNRRVFIDFDGVMANSDVWINGSHLGHRPKPDEPP